MKNPAKGKNSLKGSRDFLKTRIVGKLTYLILISIATLEIHYIPNNLFLLVYLPS